MLIFIEIPLFWRLIFSAIDIGISHRSVDSQASKKEHLMKIGIMGEGIKEIGARA
ncbi:MAG: hypothetical protein LBU32_27495 [Clostridiales bacterium]|jgi:hypothetical protein|nr:hypothetical protein [Clostridiales bacterium]